MKKVITLFLIAACGSSGGGTVDAPTNHPTDGANTDAKVFLDAPANVPATIKVSGTATLNDQSSSTPVVGATIGFFKASDDSMLGSATSGSGGTYSMTITTNGAAVDGYVKASSSGDADNYTYPSAPLVADATIDSALVTTSNFGGLGFITGQTANMGFVAAVVLDGTMQPVQGASVTSTPASGKYAYTSASSGIPDTSATATIANGQAYFINVPSGNVTLSATKSGTTFHTTVVKGHPGALTTTLIQP